MPDRIPRSTPLVASAAVVNPADLTDRLLFQYESWQDEAWAFRDSLGEYNFGITWLSGALSRVRLLAAEQIPGGDEPTPLLDGPAAELMEQLGGGIGGRAALMKSLGVQISVPGEGWIVAEREDAATPLALASWAVRSTDEIQESRERNAEFEVRTGERDWRPLPLESLVCRIWEPHARWSWKADSSSRSAIGIMREIDLYNRRIIATMVSRLAMNGLLLIPQEGTITTPPQFADAADPFVAMLIDIAGNNIKNPGGASASIPIPIRFQSELIEKWKHLTFGDGVDDPLLKARDSAVGRLATTLNMPAEVLKGMGDSNHWCTLPNVEIMTENGWRTYDQLTPGEPVLTLNHDTGLSEWQPLTAVNTWDVVNEPMIHIEGRRHSSVTTARHRWPIFSGLPAHRGRAWTTSGELASGAHADGPEKQRQEYLVLSAAHAGLPAEPKYSDALVEVVAWYYTEGNLGVREGRRTPQVVINQSPTVNPAHCSRIERALTELFGPASDRLDKGGRYASTETVERHAKVRALRAQHPTMPIAEIARQIGISDVMAGRHLRNEPKTRDSIPKWRLRRDAQLNRYNLNAAAAEVILEHAPARIVRLDFIRALTAAQLELFIDVSMKGDGYYMGPARTPVFGQKNPAMVDAIELAAILAGRSVNRKPQTGIGRSANGPCERTLDVLIISERTTFAPRGRNVTEQPYTGTIWCPTTPNGTWLARHNGTVFFTGNSAWQVSEEGIKLHISPIAETIVGGLTVGYLHPMLEALGLDVIGPHGGKIVTWYDASELTSRPDKSGQALTLYDRIELSGTALRRESGFDEGDKPSVEEIREIVLKKQTVLPNLSEQALAELTGRPVPVSPQSPVAGGPQPSGPGGDGGATAAPTPEVPPATGPPQTRDKPPPPPGPGPSGAPAAPPAAPPQASRRDVLAGVNGVTPTTLNGRHNGGRVRR